MVTMVSAMLLRCRAYVPQYYYRLAEYGRSKHLGPTVLNL